MNAVGALRRIILDDTNTVALLADSTSVYPVVLPQAKVYPAITLLIGDATPNDSKTQTSPIDKVQISVSIFAKDYNVAQKIDTAVRNAIDGFSGGVTTTPDNVEHYIDEVRFLTRRDDYDEENQLFVRMCVYDVRYYRDVPPLPFGTPYVSQATAWFNSLDEYDSDESAVLDGKSVGDIYRTSSNHVSGMGGLAKQIT